MRLIPLLLLGLLSSATLSAQPLWVASDGSIRFFSDAPLEDIEAVNPHVRSVLNRETGEVAVKLRVRQFDFPNDLMEEHFNESYLESERYPEATFAGTIQETVPYDQPGTYPVTAEGHLTLHGVRRSRTLRGTLTVAADQLTLKTKFQVKLADHQIDRPTLMLMKIAEEVEATAEFNYTPNAATPRAARP